jgi:hypothetical protein
MPIPFTCPACGRSTQVDDRFAGQSGPCSGCGQPVTVPLADGNAPLMAAPATAAPMAPAPARSGMSSMSVVAIVLAILGAGAILVIFVLVALLRPCRC